MIECYIEGTTGGETTVYPALVPVMGSSLPLPPTPAGMSAEKWRDEWRYNIEYLQSMASVLGWSPSDLLTIEVPGGASRFGMARLLMPSTTLTALYRAANGSEPAWTLKWREDAGATMNSMRVWLRPPRPLFWPSTNGVVVVECVDVRWWWQFVAAPDVTTGSLTFDGRYLGVAAEGTGGGDENALGTVKAAVEALLDALGITITLPGGFDPPAEALLCVNNLLANYSGNAALLLDMVLAECGWCLQYLPTDGTYQITEVGGDIAILGAWMNSTKRLACGGPATTADPANSGDTLLNLYNGYASSSAPGDDYVKNLGPNASGTIIGLGTREGDQKFDNQSGAPTPTTDFEVTSPVGSLRPLTDINQAVLRTSAVLPSDTSNLSGTYPWLTVDLSDIQSYRAVQYLGRQSVCCGRTVFAGWPCPPRGSFRQTNCRWTLVDMGGSAGWSPVVIPQADWDDWTLGPDGRMQMNPKELTIGRGNISVLNLNGGATMLSVAPPQVRLFMANILASPVLCDGEWRAKYKWEEVEPNDELTCATDRWAASPPMTRKWNSDAENPAYAENGAENNNVYGVSIWNGPTISEYPDSTITWRPCDPGGPVLMAEIIPTVWPFDNYPDSPRPQYVFCVPNNYDVECVTP